MTDSNFPKPTLINPVIVPSGIAASAAGDLFMSDASTGALYKWSRNTSVLERVTPLLALSNVSALAVDATGNVFIADAGSRALKLWSAATGALSTLISTGLIAPCGVALDGTGGVYVMDGGRGALMRWDAAAAVSSTLIMDAVLERSCSIAANIASGHVFLADASAATIRSWTATTGTITTVLELGSGLLSPTSIAVDSCDNLFIADSAAGRVFVRDARDGTLLPLMDGLMSPSSVTVDASGRVLASDVDRAANATHASDSRVVQWSADGPVVVNDCLQPFTFLAEDAAMIIPRRGETVVATALDAAGVLYALSVGTDGTTSAWKLAPGAEANATARVPVNTSTLPQPAPGSIVALAAAPDGTLYAAINAAVFVARPGTSSAFVSLRVLSPARSPVTVQDMAVAGRSIYYLAAGQGTDFRRGGLLSASLSDDGVAARTAATQPLVGGIGAGVFVSPRSGALMLAYTGDRPAIRTATLNQATGRQDVGTFRAFVVGASPYGVWNDSQGMVYTADLAAPAFVGHRSVLRTGVRAVWPNSGLTQIVSLLSQAQALRMDASGRAYIARKAGEFAVVVRTRPIGARARQRLACQTRDSQPQVDATLQEALLRWTGANLQSAYEGVPKAMPAAAFSVMDANVTVGATTTMVQVALRSDVSTDVISTFSWPLTVCSLHGAEEPGDTSATFPATLSQGLIPQAASSASGSQPAGQRSVLTPKYILQCLQDPVITTYAGNSPYERRYSCFGFIAQVPISTSAGTATNVNIAVRVAYACAAPSAGTSTSRPYVITHSSTICGSIQYILFTVFLPCPRMPCDLHLLRTVGAKEATYASILAQAASNPDAFCVNAMMAPLLDAIRGVIPVYNRAAASPTQATTPTQRAGDFAPDGSSWACRALRSWAATAALNDVKSVLLTVQESCGTLSLRSTSAVTSSMRLPSPAVTPTALWGLATAVLKLLDPSCAEKYNTIPIIGAIPMPMGFTCSGPHSNLYMTLLTVIPSVSGRGRARFRLLQGALSGSASAANRTSTTTNIDIVVGMTTDYGTAFSSSTSVDATSTDDSAAALLSIMEQVDVTNSLGDILAAALTPSDNNTFLPGLLANVSRATGVSLDELLQSVTFTVVSAQYDSVGDTLPPVTAATLLNLTANLNATAGNSSIETPVGNGGGGSTLSMALGVGLGLGLALTIASILTVMVLQQQRAARASFKPQLQHGRVPQSTATSCTVNAADLTLRQPRQHEVEGRFRASVM